MSPRTPRHAMRCAALALLGAAAMPAPGMAQSFPSQPVTMIVPSSAGGSADIIARVIAEPLAQSLGQPVIVENKAGAGGAIGMNAVAQARPDGYTIAIGTASTLTTNPLMNKAAKVDPLKDLAPISPLVSIPGILTVTASFKADNLDQFISQAKAHPDQYTMGSSGFGSIGHLVVEAINQELGIELRHIPYRGMGPAVVATLSGESQVLFDQYPSSRPHVLAGKLKPLAIAWKERLPDLPNVPTFAEAGYDALNALTTTWFGLVAPAGTPEQTVAALNKALLQALARPDTIAQLQKVGAQPIGDTPQALTGLISESLARNRGIIKQRGLTFD
ncbi:MAG TPA: tripartite tricarboxylate transporter substrate binding protein [Bordetella sp.]|nr:tripartite tricarboxylate transporter substrate binding protein [Bordetella sp.]